MALVVLLFLLLFFLLLALSLSAVFSFFNWVEERLGEAPSKLLFSLLWAAGFLLLALGWFETKVHFVQIGALLITVSTLYFLSESTKLPA